MTSGILVGYKASWKKKGSKCFHVPCRDDVDRTLTGELPRKGVP